MHSTNVKINIFFWKVFCVCVV